MKVMPSEAQMAEGEKIEYCKDCRFWKIGLDSSGVCRRFPSPSAQGGTEEDCARRIYTRGDDWCGEWKPKVEGVWGKGRWFSFPVRSEKSGEYLGQIVAVDEENKTITIESTEKKKPIPEIKGAAYIHLPDAEKYAVDTVGWSEEQRGAFMRGVRWSQNNFKQ